MIQGQFDSPKAQVLTAIEYYLERLRSGAWEQALFGLLDLGADAVPLLIFEADKESNRPIRADLIKVIWQYRSSDAIDFLGRCLSDSNAEVCKEALDGLVAIGGSRAIDRIRAMKLRLEQRPSPSGLTVDWLTEALEQV